MLFSGDVVLVNENREKGWSQKVHKSLESKIFRISTANMKVHYVTLAKLWEEIRCRPYPLARKYQGE